MKDFTAIKALVMDVDGTLTDGSLYIGKDGEVMKKFHVKDGYAIKELLTQMEIIPIILTGRVSDIVESRCRELCISCVVQGSKNKLFDLCEILSKNNLQLTETAYMGDDINDIECMKAVGIVGCPSDAVKEIKAISDYITTCSGGNGAVREFVEWIKENRIK
ncbi:KdsC family phosphatase [Lacrimispora sp.]|uniref:KdsC family phosphatase n=1 Tax=Lacrimispora sp. TaxID=2719234 RepID=UPI00289A5141|nr:HAD-IIIA family hydrolase [Lacrimispora sp.]